MNKAIIIRRISIILFAAAILATLGFPQSYVSKADTAKILEVPTVEDQLFPWLQDQAYKLWYHEAAAHQSSGPHGQVLDYLNPTLEASMKAGDSEHPIGSAAVKELYANGHVTGWVVMVKTMATSNNGAGWYWYGVTSTTDSTQVVASGNGASACTGCHSSGGHDFIKIPFPFVNGVEQTELPPASKTELLTWLQGKNYSAWAKESAIHPSAGPHGDVLTYFNPVLEQSFKAGNTTHPMGAASVKELFTAGELSGWSVMIKTQDDSADGAGWYWFQTKSTTDPEQIMVADYGAAGCVSCHTSGVDLIRTGYPLQ
jgi:hypothetical protein